jgi:hypothetical protein
MLLKLEVRPLAARGENHFSVADDLFEAVTIGPHRLDLLGRFNQRLDARLRVTVVSILHGHADDRGSFSFASDRPERDPRAWASQ